MDLSLTSKTLSTKWLGVVLLDVPPTVCLLIMHEGERGLGYRGKDYTNPLVLIRGEQH